MKILDLYDDALIKIFRYYIEESTSVETQHYTHSPSEVQARYPNNIPFSLRFDKAVPIELILTCKKFRGIIQTYRSDLELKTPFPQLGPKANQVQTAFISFKPEVAEANKKNFEDKRLFSYMLGATELTMRRMLKRKKERSDSIFKKLIDRLNTPLFEYMGILRSPVIETLMIKCLHPLTNEPFVLVSFDSLNKRSLGYGHAETYTFVVATHHYFHVDTTNLGTIPSRLTEVENLEEIHEHLDNILPPILGNLLFQPFHLRPLLPTTYEVEMSGMEMF